MEDFRIKYRPRKIEEVWGNEHIKKIWGGFSKRKMYPASTVLYGQYGTGKTTIGEIIAKEITINKTDPAFRPFSDIIKIDTALYDFEMLLKKLEDIRWYLGNPPAVFIDEAHGLPEKSQRLFLERIEYDDLHYIFATTELNKMQGGILSRSTKFKLKAPTVSEAEKKLSNIAKIENINISKDAIRLICDYGKCNPRECKGILYEIPPLEGMITESILKEILELNTD
ncbi:MAG: AAA family ATPase [Candidatus Omnitrophica bacterium]|nr:AAA family ATPase [Candidatus Omnitrophota bacterium]